jgi:DNA end-binding protein Ku
MESDQVSRHHTEELRDLIARRAKGETITIEESPAETAKVVDLMAALSASVAAAKRGRKGSMNKAFERAARELVPRDDEDEDAKVRPASRTGRRKSARAKGTPRKSATRRGGARKSA